MSAGEDKTEERGTCTPCRGRGKVSSALGGEQHEVTCPWCGGSGRFQPGRDAQESPAEHDTRPPTAEPGAPAEQDAR